ncbi:acetate kinase [Ruficoccus amylovorans]|uniref:Acetate kinase n=1 Tax=Ruficoccus amylovorans TaxID=1804625 RepID=A0A842HC62_9BACT|nr:acetate kinase [Ruficoccus amylovorans]
MKILVANLGSTSFKYRLFKFGAGEETLLAKGGYERVEDHGAVIEDCLKVLQEQGHLDSVEDLDAVGFKTVLGKNLSGCVEADDKVLEALAGFEAIAPAHNPAYANGIRQFARVMPGVTRVALFETAFYQWMSEAACRYAVPESWYELGVRRYGFHGASHKFVAERSAQLLGRDDVAEKVQRLYQKGDTAVERPLRIISCHLGGSSSITGICNGVAIGSSMGFSPQGGLPQNNRVGDLDSMAVPYMAKVGGLSIDEIERQMTKEGGLLGLSGVSNDLRDLIEAADDGNQRARLAIDVLIHSIRQWAGGFFWQMGGIDAIAFTGGIGENNAALRAAVCAGLEPFGLKIDPAANDSLKGEGNISVPGSSIPALVIPANEELVVAREVHRFMEARLTPAS